MRLPDLQKDEKIIFSSQGTLCTLCCRNSWREGHLFLTNKRLIFNYITKQVFETSLNNIRKLSIHKRTWLLGVRIRQVCIEANSKNGEEQVYIVLSKPKKWSYKIKESMTLMLAEGCGYNGTNAESTGNT